jgi:hypothetical protein
LGAGLLDDAPSSPVETTGADSGTTSYTGVIRDADEADECAHTALSLIYRRERDEAREDCGFQKGLKDSIKGELSTFIRLRQEALDLVAGRDATIERMGKVAADALDLLIKERDEALATIERVNVLHQESKSGGWCIQQEGGHNEVWPCPTAVALTTNQLPVAPKLVVDAPNPRIPPPYTPKPVRSGPGGAPCPYSCSGQSWTGVDTSRGRRWRCDTCGRVISRHVSDAIQAADDMRSL